jgi:hypothetical protein
MVKQAQLIKLFVSTLIFTQLHATHNSFAYQSSRREYGSDLISGDTKNPIDVAKELIYAISHPDYDLEQIVSWVKSAKSSGVKTINGVSFFDVACDNGYGLIGACVQHVLDSDWEIEFLEGLFHQLTFCCEKTLVLSPEGITEELFERYTQALNNCVEMVIRRSN